MPPPLLVAVETDTRSSRIVLRYEMAFSFFLIFETAKKRKSKSEFRCGFLFEEPGGFKGGEPGFVRPVRQNPGSV